MHEWYLHYLQSKMGNPKWSQILFEDMITLAAFFICNIILAFATDPIIQQEQDRIVSPLPGQNFNINFEHYSGYITVNKDVGRNLFYWFIEADHIDPTSKPLLLWFNGGPGCSSIAYGEAEEIGPFHINSDGNTLYLNPYSWNQGEWLCLTIQKMYMSYDVLHASFHFDFFAVANILFIDSPVGVGFSYSNASTDILNNGDKRTGKKILLNGIWIPYIYNYTRLHALVDLGY